MDSLGCLLVCTFGNLLAHVLVVAHTVNNVDFGSEAEEDERLRKWTIKFDHRSNLKGINKMSDLFNKDMF